MVPDKRIASVARAEKAPDKAVAALIAAALEAGGVDNVTAVLVQVGELPPPLTPRKPIPLAMPPDEAETDDGDVPTASGDTDKTDEAFTSATLLPEESLDVEIPTQAVESSPARSKRFRLPRRVAWIVLAGVLIAVCCGIALFFVQRRGEGHTAEPNATSESSATKEANVTVEVTAPAASPEPPKAVPKAASPEPPKAVPKAASPEPPKAVPKALLPAPKASACADFIAACGDESAQAFVRALRRLLPQDERTSDFAEESERFLKGARKLALTRGSREAEAAAVDLRVLLLNAEAARSALVQRKADAAAKSVLPTWDDVLKGDPSDAATQMLCARLIMAVKDLR